MVGWPRSFWRHNDFKRARSLFACCYSGYNPARLGGQEQNLLPHSDPDVRALYEAQTALRVFGDNPFDPISDITSPDSAKPKILDAAASNGAYYLRATADLLAIYENLQCEADRTTIKPLLTDRLRPHSRLLGFEAEKAAIPLGYANQPATTKRALKLRDDLLAARNKVDAIITSLK